MTNPPTNVIVCINTLAEINCGFTGADPNLVAPNWRIIMRNENMVSLLVMKLFLVQTL